MERSELKIGQIGIIDGVKVECVEHGSRRCAKQMCAFYKFGLCEACDSIETECRADYRSDHTDVYFKKVEECKQLLKQRMI